MSLVAIDGPAGAGKTTLAAKFYEEFCNDKTVSVIHMDDLYNGWDNALSEPLTQKLKVITEAFLAHEVFQVEVFNWVTMKFDAIQKYEPVDILILEGVGAAQKIVRDAGAITYWLDVEPSIGLDRVLQRDGFDMRARMLKWQIDQERHFERDLTRLKAHHIVTS